MNTPKANAVLVEALGSSLRRGGNALDDIPDLLKRILREEAWREFITPRGALVRHGRFVDFVTTTPTAGLGASVELVERIVVDDPEAVTLLRDVLKEKPGPKSRDVITRTETGTSRGYALQRLLRDAPELHAEVLAKRLSAHAAMVQAGFQPKTISIPIARPESVARALRKHMTPDDLAQLIQLLLHEP